MIDPTNTVQPPKSWFARFFSPRIEDSIRLRVLVMASLWLGALGLSWVGGSLWITLVGGGLGTLGYWLSWRWRHRRSLARPLLVAAAIIAVSFYMRSQMLEVFNGNWLPVGQFLVFVQAFSSFESRTRAGLYSGLVLSGSTLFLASQQAFDPSFGIFVVGFVVVLLAFLTMAFLEDGIRGARVHWTHFRPGRSSMLPYWIGVACAVFILSGLAFWVMSRGELALASPAQLAVLPYSGASLGEEYQAPLVYPVNLDPDYLPGNTDRSAQSRADRDSDRQFLDRADSGPQDEGTANLPVNVLASGRFDEGADPTSYSLLNATGDEGRTASNSDTLMFVRSKVTSYWRGRALEHFAGQAWRSDSFSTALVPSATKPGVWFNRDNLSRGSEALYQQTYFVQQEDLNALLTGYSALSVDTLDGSLSNAGVERRTTYRVLSAYPRHTSERLSRDSTWVASRQLVSIPPALQGELLLLANRITDGASSDFDRIERIVSYLRQQGTFDPGWPRNPTAEAELENFLIQRQPGNAMDYATATVMLARASRLPARVAVGYLPGSLDPLSGAYRVRKDDAHAWAEIYFANHGWVPFDSSPRGEPARAGQGGARAEFMFNAGAGDAVFGAVKSAPTQLIDLLMGAVRSPVISILVPALFLIVLLLRWGHSRKKKIVASGKALLSYKERLTGEDRRQLLGLYDELKNVEKKVTSPPGIVADGSRLRRSSNRWRPTGPVSGQLVHSGGVACGL